MSYGPRRVILSLMAILFSSAKANRDNPTSPAISRPRMWKLQPPSARRTQVYLLFGSRLVQTIVRMAMGPLVVYVCEEMQCDVSTKGTLLSAYSLGYLTSQLAGGVLADRIGAKGVVLLASLLGGLLTLLSAGAKDISSLWLMQVLLGVSQGPLFPTSGARRRDRARLRAASPRPPRRAPPTADRSGLPRGLDAARRARLRLHAPRHRHHRRLARRAAVLRPPRLHPRMARDFRRVRRAHAALLPLLAAARGRAPRRLPLHLGGRAPDAHCQGAEIGPRSARDRRGRRGRRVAASPPPLGAPSPPPPPPRPQVAPPTNSRQVEPTSARQRAPSSKRSIARTLLGSAALWSLFVSHMAFNFGVYFLTSWSPTYFEQAGPPLPNSNRRDGRHAIRLTPMPRPQELGIRPEKAALALSIPPLVNCAVKAVLNQPLEQHLVRTHGFASLHCRRFFSLVGFTGASLGLLSIPAASRALGATGATAAFAIAFGASALHAAGFKANYLGATVAHSHRQHLR